MPSGYNLVGPAAKRHSRWTRPQGLATVVYELRTRQGLRQRDVADMIGIEPSYLSAIERGVARPTPDQLMRLALAFQVSVNRLQERPQP